MKRILSILLAAILLFSTIPVVTIAAAPESFATRFSVNKLDGKWKDAAATEHETISVEYQLKGQGIKGVQGAWVAVDISKLIWADIEIDEGNINDYIGEGKSIIPGKSPTILSIMEGDEDISSYFYELKAEVKEGRKVVDSWTFSANNYIYVAVSADGNTLYICPQPSQGYSVNYDDFTTVVKFRFAIRPGTVVDSDSIRFITDDERNALNQSYKVAMFDGVTGFYQGNRFEADTLPAPAITGDAGITGEPSAPAPVDAEAPVITTSPTGAVYAVNAAATALTVAATVNDGGTITYAWYKNTANSNEGGELVGSESTYTPSTDTLGTVYYYAVVTNTNESATGAKTATTKTDAVAVEVKDACDVSGHSWSTEWTTDGDGHWHACSVCSEKNDYAPHVYDQTVVDEKYFAFAADCDDAAQYYKSCACGVASTDTFTDGVALGHDWATEWTTDGDAHWHACSRCSEKDSYAPHVYDQTVVDEKYFAFAADCDDAAQYYKSCVCGLAGTDTFTDGVALGHDWATEWTIDGTHHWHICSRCDEKDSYAEHVYDQTVVDEKYFVSGADCENAAKYNKSCVCGLAGTDTFDDGVALGHDFATEWTTDGDAHWHACSRCDEKDAYAEHNYINEVKDDKYIASGTNCTDPASYYKSCVCGLAGTDTFYDGLALGHDFATEWTTDGDAHWHACSRCDEKDSYAAHVYNNEVKDEKYFAAGVSCTEAATYYKSCVCGLAGTDTFTDGVALGHDFATEWTTDGDAHWYACSRCDEKDGYTAHVYDQTVVSDEFLASPADCENAAKYYKSCVCGVASAETFDEGAALGHNWGTEWTADKTGHWYACSRCDDKKDFAEHTPGEPATIDKDQICTVCEYIITPKFGHQIEEEWKVDENGHWKDCSCGEAHSAAPHTASAWFSDGDVRYRECTVCGYLMDYLVLGADDKDDKPEEDEKDGWFDTVIALLSRKYVVVAIAGEGGDITSEGTTVVRYGKSVTYKIEADDGYEVESVYVDGKNIGAVSEFTLKNVKGDHTIKVKFKESWFKDVSKDADYYEAVKFVVEKGLFNGVSDTKFAPDTTMTRAMFVTVLWRLEGEPVVNYSMNFDDVVADTWYTEAVRWAASEGIVLGYGDGKFGVDNQITVEQAAVILARYAEYVNKYTRATEDLSAYHDATSVSDWALEQMKWAVENGIYEGNKSNLHPATHAPRYLVAEMLYRAYNLLTK